MERGVASRQELDSGLEFGAVMAGGIGGEADDVAFGVDEEAEPGLVADGESAEGVVAAGGVDDDETAQGRMGGDGPAEWSVSVGGDGGDGVVET